MADIIKAATRDGYGKALVELGAINDKLVVLDADLAEATKTAMFKKAYPDRFFDSGIAEGNMIGDDRTRGRSRARRQTWSTSWSSPIRRN